MSCPTPIIEVEADCRPASDVKPPDRQPRTRVAAKSLRANFSWMLAGNAIFSACNWGLLAVLAHLGTPAMVGQYVLALAVTSPVIVFFMLHLRAVAATDARGQYEFGHYLALRLAAM